jgi:hypothetical protein
MFILEVVLIQLFSWRRTQSCSKHVEDSNKHFIEGIVRQVGYLPELYKQVIGSEQHSNLSFHIGFVVDKIVLCSQHPFTAPLPCMNTIIETCRSLMNGYKKLGFFVSSEQPNKPDATILQTLPHNGIQTYSSDQTEDKHSWDPGRSWNIKNISQISC